MTNKKAFLLRPGSFKEQEGVHPRSCCLPWTLKYIQSLLREKNIPVKFYDLKLEGNTIEEAISLIHKYKPTHIVIQVNSLEYCGCKQLLKRIKNHTQAEVILVGQYPTYCHDSSLADISFRGESELAVTEYIITGNRALIDENKLNIVDGLKELPFPCYEKHEYLLFGYQSL